MGMRVKIKHGRKEPRIRVLPACLFLAGPLSFFTLIWAGPAAPLSLVSTFKRFSVMGVVSGYAIRASGWAQPPGQTSDYLSQCCGRMHRFSHKVPRIQSYSFQYNTIQKHSTRVSTVSWPPGMVLGKPDGRPPWIERIRMTRGKLEICSLSASGRTQNLQPSNYT